MSFRFIRHRKDNSQDPIVEGLEKAGYTVERDGKVDLLVRHPTWESNRWVKLEAKTKNRKEGFKPRKDQEDQTQYCIAHRIPYVMTIEDALEYLKRCHAQLRIGRVA